MEPPPRPKLKIKFSSSNLIANTDQPSPETPSTQTPVRTPSLKLNFGNRSASTTPAPGSVPPTPSEDGITPTGSAKKRKRDTAISLPESRPSLSKQPTLLKLITKNSVPTTTKNVAPTPGIKLKTKGKIPKRPAGVGYDSELEEREIDPVILEGIVLRMMPGEDCDYIRDSIANGTVGVSVLQKGADIRLRMLDVNGRRGVLYVRRKQYAISVVDLPTITEGMKSWDKKNWIKSIDISQIILVLGRCNSDEEARDYPLPPDVDPKNFQYAHGLTAPMWNVRKRRFERTARTRLDDIEAIERKVNQLLEADSKASEVRYDVLDHDPRQDEELYSETYDSDDDAEAEDDDEGEDGYFPTQTGGQPDDYNDAEEAQYANEDISALEAMFEEGDDDMVVDTSAPAADQALVGGALVPSAADLAASESPAIATSAEDTPVTPAADGEDDASDEGGEGEDESDAEAQDEKAETLAKIKEAEDKIAQQRESLKRTHNQILKKKIAKKIQDLESDIRMMKRHAGLIEGEGEGSGSEEE